METVVSVKNLVKKYGNFTAVRELNLSICKGEIYGLLGPNGSGKTTTIKVLCGLLHITSGEVAVLGEKIPTKKIAPHIGYMPQETAIYMGLTVYQNMEFFASVYGMEKQAFEEAAKTVLDFVELSNWKDKMVTALSGGMRHRTSLACSLIHSPALLFLDEPTVGVDPDLRASFWNHFNQLKSTGKTILMTTHYMDEAMHCDRIGFMRGGKLIAEGTPAELLEKSGTKGLEEAFLYFAKQEKEEVL